MLKAVIFDMDGVIIDSEPMHNKAYHDMFNEVGIEVSTEFLSHSQGNPQSTSVNAYATILVWINLLKL